MAAHEVRDPGLFTGLLEAGSDDTPAPWCCPCCWCGSGGLDLGAFAPPPTAGYLYVGPAEAPDEPGPVAPLIAGSKWSSVDPVSDTTIVSYSFIDPATSVFAYGTLGGFAAGAMAFSEADRQLTRELLAKISAVANITFVEVADDASVSGVLRFGYSREPNTMKYAGFAFFPSDAAIGGDIWIGADQAGAQWDFYRPNLILHETLHALGLKHPFSGPAVLPTAQDIIPNTVMSYSAVAGGSAGMMSDYPAEPMAYDVAALQQLYGAARSNSGNDWYALDAMHDGFRTLWDSAGTDVLDASGIGHGVTLNLAAGASSDIGVRVDATAKMGTTPVATTYALTLTIAPGAAIENAIGSAAADTITGNDLDNRLQGRGGNDALHGGAGLDTAAYEGSRGDFQVRQSGGEATVADRTGAEGADTLTGIERIEFADGGLALDLDGQAGVAARVLGAVFGPAAVQVPQVVGVALDALASGIAYTDALQLALDVRLGTDPTDAEVVNLLYTNVVGHAPDAAAFAEVMGLLEGGFADHAGLVALAANHPLLALQIDLVGLAATGLAYA